MPWVRTTDQSEQACMIKCHDQMASLNVPRLQPLHLHITKCQSISHSTHIRCVVFVASNQQSICYYRCSDNTVFVSCNAESDKQWYTFLYVFIPKCRIRHGPLTCTWHLAHSNTHGWTQSSLCGRVPYAHAFGCHESKPDRMKSQTGETDQLLVFWKVRFHTSWTTWHINAHAVWSLHVHYIHACTISVHTRSQIMHSTASSWSQILYLTQEKWPHIIYKNQTQNVHPVQPHPAYHLYMGAQPKGMQTSRT